MTLLIGIMVIIIVWYYGNFYCMSCLHLFKTKSKLESHKKACENNDFCDAVMSSKDSKILEFDQNKRKHLLLFSWVFD